MGERESSVSCFSGSAQSRLGRGPGFRLATTSDVRTSWERRCHAVAGFFKPRVVVTNRLYIEYYVHEMRDLFERILNGESHKVSHNWLQVATS